MKALTAFLLVCTTLFPLCVRAEEPPVPPSNVKEWLASQSRARKAGAIGAAAGAIRGWFRGKRSGAKQDEVWKETIAGGIQGGLAGYAIGKHLDTIYAGRDHAVRETGYKKSQGYIARIQKVSFDPPQPKPGTTATLIIRYVVIGPDPNESIEVKVFRGLKYDDSYIFGEGPSPFEIPHGGAIVESKVPVTFAENTPVGTYAVEALLEDPKNRFQQAVVKSALHIVARAERAEEAVTAAP